jgi:hypothetical protein
MSPSPKKSMSWMLFYAFLTVFCWGVYGLFLYWGQQGIGLKDPMARYKAFLFVGFAYALVAILAPLAYLRLFGKPGDTNFFSYPTKGWTWALIAGTVGAFGAFGLLLAFGSAPNVSYVPVVMCIVFGCAPIVNAFATIAFEEGKFQIKPQFYVGIILAAVGGCLVALYRPEKIGGHGPAAPATPPAHVATAIGAPAAAEPAAKH